MDYDKILRRFPPISYAFAYGSGVFQQAGYDNISAPNGNQPMYDVILVVDDPISWHAQNIKMNRSDYSGISWLGLIGSRLISYIQDAYGTGVWFNPLVAIEPEYTVQGMGNCKMKYGVISSSAFTEDLVTWNHLYISGRMHKPVRELQINASIDSKKSNRSAYISESGKVPFSLPENWSDEGNIGSRGHRFSPYILHNRLNALRASLIMLPERFTEIQLYSTIASLSYEGDWRMKFGENPEKVQNIVTGSLNHFQTLYRPLLNKYFDDVILTAKVLDGESAPVPGIPNSVTDGTQPLLSFVQSKAPETQRQMLSHLPRGVLEPLSKSIHVLYSGQDDRDSWVSDCFPPSPAVHPAIFTSAAFSPIISDENTLSTMEKRSRSHFDGANEPEYPTPADIVQAAPWQQLEAWYRRSGMQPPVSLYRKLIEKCVSSRSEVLDLMKAAASVDMNATYKKFTEWYSSKDKKTEETLSMIGSNFTTHCVATDIHYLQDLLSNQVKAQMESTKSTENTRSAAVNDAIGACPEDSISSEIPRLKRNIDSNAQEFSSLNQDSLSWEYQGLWEKVRQNILADGSKNYSFREALKVRRLVRKSKENLLIGDEVYVLSGDSNYCAGKQILIDGAGNVCLGDNITVVGSNNFIVGSNISVIGSNNTCIGTFLGVFPSSFVNNAFFVSELDYLNGAKENFANGSKSSVSGSDGSLSSLIRQARKPQDLMNAVELTKKNILIGSALLSVSLHSTSIGAGNLVYGQRCRAIGAANVVSGTKNSVIGESSGAFGVDVSISGKKCLAIGSHIRLRGDRLNLLGDNVKEWSTWKKNHKAEVCKDYRLATSNERLDFPTESIPVKFTESIPDKYFASTIRDTASGIFQAPVVPFLRQSIGRLVATGAKTQSLKGILTAGPIKTTEYSIAKLRKYFKSIRKLK